MVSFAAPLVSAKNTVARASSAIMITTAMAPPSIVSASATEAMGSVVPTTRMAMFRLVNEIIDV